MKKATQKTTPLNLGTKRACPDCNTKFYDFGKNDVVCPKCETKLNLEELDPIARLQPEPRKVSKPVEKQGTEPALSGDDIVATESDDIIESVDDLDDSDDDLVEDIDVDEEEGNNY